MKSTKPTRKRKTILQCYEEDFPKADKALSIIAGYKGTHRLPTMIDALLELLEKVEKQ